jgi:enediyne biosynthesis protein E3
VTSPEDRTVSLPLSQGNPGARTLAAVLRRKIFGISPEETTFARRGFRATDAAVRERLEEVGRCFVRGYHAALEEDRPLPLAARIEREVERSFRGFAYEGAGMALALLDALIPGRRDRLLRFLAGPGEPQAYIVRVGAGWILARLPLSPERLLARLGDPLLGWLALDGYGFHEGFFHWPRSVVRQAVPRKLRGYARRSFDQGLGRSLWFVDGADVERIPRTIGAFPRERQADLWSGVGLACAYAGGAGTAPERAAADLAELRRAAGNCAPQLAQGVAFAAKARERAGNPAAHTELACQAVWGTTAADAAAVCDLSLHGLPVDGSGEVAFESWRRQIQDCFTKGSAR